MALRSAYCYLVAATLTGPALAVAAPATTPAESFLARLGLAPTEAAEVDLRDTLTRRRTVVDLRAMSGRYPGSTVSGLAQIAAGYAALGSANPGEALVSFRHPDVTATQLRDLAAFGEGEALALTVDAGGSAEAYRRAAQLRPGGILFCQATLRAVEQMLRAGEAKQAEELIEEAPSCPASSDWLAVKAEAYDQAGNKREAAVAYADLDTEYPTSDEAAVARLRLAALSAALPPRSNAERNERALRKALAVYDAREYGQAVSALRAVKPSGQDRWLVATRLGHALVASGRRKEGERTLRAVPPTSEYGAEAAYQLARLRKDRAAAMRRVANRFRGTSWGEEALLSLVSEAVRKDNDAAATDLYRRLRDEYPDGQYIDRAIRRVAWADHKAGRFEKAASDLEAAAKRRTGNTVAGFLYWAGRARAALGHTDKARQLYAETVRRFRVLYYGGLAAEALAKLPPASSTSVPLLSAPVASRLDLPPGDLTRVRQLVLIDRHDNALTEISRLPASTATRAATGWIEARRGRLRPAIIAMKGAFPDYLGEGGEALPDDVWRVIYPLEYRDSLQERAARHGIEPALLAALVCQESTFDANAISRAGARGLMQIMPATGRSIARTLGRAFRTLILHEPDVSLDFGVFYLSNMLRRFGGRVERTLAAYNAGPSRVVAWTAGEPDMPAEDFVETIPFSETRLYVMTILAARDQYKRLYWDSTRQPEKRATF